MVMLSLPGVRKFRSKAGKIYYYLGRGGPRIEGEPGTPEFLRSYEELRNPTSALDRSKFGTWVALYKGSEEFAELAPRTRKEWLPWLDRVKDEFGQLRVRHFDRPQIRVAIRAWRNKWRKTPRTADYAKQVLSRVCTYLAANGAIQNNPCKAIENLYSADRADLIWTEADMATLFKACSPEIANAAKLAAFTGLRESDLLRLAWSHVGTHHIEFRTSKSRGRKTVLIPITGGLRAALDAIPKRSTTILTNTNGRPWQSGFTSSWRKAVIRAGLADRDLHFHDFRGTAATNLYRADFSIREIAVILGWTEDKVERLIDRYVKRDELILDRIRRLEKVERRTKPAKNRAKSV